MISREKNPDYLNGFLDYMVTIQNKSPNTWFGLKIQNSNEESNHNHTEVLSILHKYSLNAYN